ncbi:MAG: AAA family ATPase, partial [Lentisphaeria bacterium]
MKIQKLRFKNIASLNGSWEIDFTTPDYTDNGIFGIFGPTGSGKTTILDAICLAIYGKTPRLDKLSQSSNEIMSRHTGECFAAVIYQTEQGSFQSFWSQSRARGKADGALQTPKCELTDLTKNKIITTKLSEIEQATIKVVGLDFQQFTKSIMLSQGEFAAFIKANENERSSILEKLTGTEIYGEISKLVSSKKLEESRKLDQKMSALDSLLLPSSDEIANIHAENQLLQEKIKNLENEKILNDHTIAWLNKIDELTNLQKNAQQKIEQTKQANLQFLPQKQQLENALKADKITPIYNQIKAARTTKNDLEKAINEQTTQIQNLTEKINQEISENEKISTEITSLKHNLLALQQTTAHVDRLDTQINELIIQQKPLVEKIENLKKEKSQNEITYTKIENELIKLQNKQKQIQAEQAIIPHANLLIEQLPILHTSLSQLENDHKLMQQKINEQKNNQISITNLNHKIHEISQILDDHKPQKEHNQNQYEKFISLQKSLLQNQDLDYWLNQKNTLELQQKKLNITTLSNQEIIDLIAKNNQLQNEILQQNQQLNQQTSQLKIAQNNQEQTQNQYNQATEIKRLKETIKNLEDYRKELKQNEPCPLCGAIEHPYFVHAPIINHDQDDLKIRELAIKLDDCKNITITLKNQIETLQKNIATNQISHQTTQKSITEKIQKIGEEICAENLVSFHENQQKLLEITTEEIHKINEIITENQRIQNQINANLKEKNLLQESTKTQEQHLIEFNASAKNLTQSNEQL